MLHSHVFGSFPYGLLLSGYGVSFPLQLASCELALSSTPDCCQPLEPFCSSVILCSEGNPSIIQLGCPWAGEGLVINLEEVL